ncbi:hypothetical protein PANT111_40021 [Pantoea brenneri]|uniref:Uncharacterized protein n=1 Tax=Pantoea brenneri TaxID=472694 RepID=A0AAX3JA10_9GAMM|nr:hypothetical protein PANT111_40021 [Pantoea brenneri]
MRLLRPQLRLRWQLKVKPGDANGVGPANVQAKSSQWAGKELPPFCGVLARAPDNPRWIKPLLSRNILRCTNQC